MVDTRDLETSLPQVAPGRRRSRGLSKAQMEEQFPSLTHLTAAPAKATSSAWVAVFNARPDAMHRLLADYIKQVHARPGRIGQRPMPDEEEVDFHDLVYGEDNEEPLTAVLPKLMKQRRLGSRSLVERCSTISRSQLQRILAGSYDPTVDELRQLAKALRKPPVYFLEYRKAMAVAAFLNLINERPGIATELYRKHLEVRMGD